jgi:hypothetical protein
MHTLSRAGTASCDVWEVDDTPRVLVPGQQGELWGLAMNPAYPHVFATACDSDTVMVWSAATRQVCEGGGTSSWCGALSLNRWVVGGWVGEETQWDT